MNLHRYNIRSTSLISSMFLVLLLVLAFLLLHKYAYNFEKTKVTYSTSASINKTINSAIAEHYSSKTDTTNGKTAAEFIKSKLIPIIKSKVSLPLGINDETIVITSNDEDNIIASCNVPQGNKTWQKESIRVNFCIQSENSNQNYTCFYYIKDLKILVLSRLKSAMFLTILLIIFFAVIFVFIISRWKNGSKESALKDDFFQNVTHELKTPIATTAIATDIFKKFDYKLTPEKTKSYIEIIEEENRKMKQIVDRLLSISIVDNSESKMVLSKVDIHKILNRTIKNFKFLVSERGGTIEEQIDAKHAVIWGDESYITMIFTNLIDNAIKYSIKPPQIKISTHSDKKGIYISVSDHGIGIPADALNKIFIKTFRIKNNHNIKGFGLGLYFVKQLVEIHRGKIEVKSELGKGTEFTVFLPFNKDKEK